MLLDHLPHSIAVSHTAPQLDELSRTVTVANGGGRLGDAEAIELHEAIAARRCELRERRARPVPRIMRPALPKALSAPSPTSPDRLASLLRRRQRAAEGWMRPEDAKGFTQGEQAVLAVIAFEVRTKGLCGLPIDAIGAFAGVGRTVVKAAQRLAERLGLLTVTERRVARDRNDTNLVRVTSPLWLRWLRRRSVRKKKLEAERTARGGVGSDGRLGPNTQSLEGDRATRPASAPRYGGGADARSALGAAGGTIRAPSGPIASRWTRLQGLGPAGP